MCVTTTDSLEGFPLPKLSSNENYQLDPQVHYVQQSVLVSWQLAKSDCHGIPA